jgi:membrane-associated phospholipid phosphatase
VVEKIAKTAAELKLYAGPQDRMERGNLRVPLLLVTLLTAGMVPVATVFDISIARWFVSRPMPGDVTKTIELAECYAHGIGVIFFVILIMQLAPRKRWCLPRLATMAFGAGAIGVLVKTFVLRGRPSGLNLEVASYDAAWRWTFDWTLDHVASFDSGFRSFPSGHTAIAAGLTVGLCLMFPRGRSMFVFLLGLAMMQRLSSCSHFASDLMGGLALGLFWSYACLSPRLVGALFDKIEPSGRGFERQRAELAKRRAA